VAPGLISCEGVELRATTNGLAAGSEVVWCARPERIRPDPAGDYHAVVLDEADLGVTHELTVALEERLELLLRTADPLELAVGEELRVALAPEDITLWASECRPRCSPHRTGATARRSLSTRAMLVTTQAIPRRDQEKGEENGSH